MQIYRVSDPDWATSAELVLNEPEQPDTANLVLGAETRHPVQFVVFTAATPEGTWSPELDARLTLLDNDLRPFEWQGPSERQYLSPDRQVAILIQPEGHSWIASIYRDGSPVGLSAMAFHPAPAAAQAPRLRCRVCRSTAKALAVAIVAAAGAAGAGIALPAALIAAVGAFLGVATAAAVAFINSVLGDVASVVADKLCLAAGLCP
ncbi:hypothetical protein [Hydrogenophaga palleronii]|uniref:hypothetical protein n=1 Tax=Hydrogenophaga palleronii TaxID=65655 RepID=UPI0008260C86|nr:hypothetical protein [Hydrogenophaga palleronii]